MGVSKRIHIISTLLLVVFAGYYVGVTLFSHIHFSNGVMLVHSHPYSKTSSHDHTSGQLLVLSLLAKGLQIENTTIVSLLSIILPITVLFFLPVRLIYTPIVHLLYITLRAPPKVN